MCLIRQDLTTVWCEVTSSIRTRSADEESSEATPTPQSGAAGVDNNVAKDEVRELLLCLRPIRDGEKKVDESLRFVSPKRIDPEQGTAEGMVSSSSGDARKEENSSEKTSTGSGSNNSNSALAGTQPKRPPKKRVLPTNGGSQQKKTKKANGSKPTSEDAEKSVVESLMLMNKSSQ